MLALALQGIGGMNSFAAGVLQTLRKEGVKPDLISATSGAILSAYYFLQKDTNAIEKHYDEYFKSEENGIPTLFKFMQYAYLGVPNKFSPNYLNVIERLSDNWPFLRSEEWINFCFPNKIYKSEFPQQFFDDIANCFSTNEEVGIIMNAYNVNNDQAVLYVNERAWDTMELTKRGNFEVKPITPDGVRACLQLLQYGDYKGEYDGAYQYNPVLSPLVVADEIILATVAPLGKSLDQIDNFFDIEDFKLKMLFKNALYAELNDISRINKLIEYGNKLVRPESENKPYKEYKSIKVQTIQPTIHRGLFEYFVETREFYEDGVSQAKKFIDDSLNKQIQIERG
ncbi:patatin-like phospholipase family protein [Priestia megaterium]|uniref:Patatin-like phospholipase family protein n=1 Tax=Priestia megaterium TaxID=1404 RepID=A0A6H1P090_PRIMG|nr:patatin-like phospholipase family protein [Priestia megaterium]QIZ06963.1 patatin-like phospholipase family protein [Priestia megaterium]